MEKPLDISSQLFEVLSGFMAGAMLSGEIVPVSAAMSLDETGLVLEIGGETRSYTPEALASIQREIMRAMGGTHGH